MTYQHNIHNFISHQAPAEGSSDRSFGLVFAAFFLLCALLPLLHGHEIRGWAIGLSASFFIIALTIPFILAPLNRLWTKFGALLHSIVSPVALGILFFCVITPIGLWMRLLRKDLLRLRYDSLTHSYWIARTPPGPNAESLKNQF